MSNNIRGKKIRVGTRPVRLSPLRLTMRAVTPALK